MPKHEIDGNEEDAEVRRRNLEYHRAHPYRPPWDLKWFSADVGSGAKEGESLAGLRALEDGEECAWNRFFRAYYRRLLRFVQHRSFGLEDAEDIVSETLMKVFLKLDKYDGTRPFNNWLFVVTRNTANDWRNALANQYQSSQGIKFDCYDMESDEHPNDGDIDGLRRERKIRLHGHLETLAASHRQIIRLRFFSGFATSEVAEQFYGRSDERKDAAARALLCRALKSLSGPVLGDPFFEENPIPEKPEPLHLPFSDEEIRREYFLEMGRWRQAAKSVGMPSLQDYDALEHIVLVRSPEDGVTEEGLAEGKGEVDFEAGSREYKILRPDFTDSDVRRRATAKTLGEMFTRLEATTGVLREQGEEYWHGVFSERVRQWTRSHYVAKGGWWVEAGASDTREFRKERKRVTWDRWKKGSIGGETWYLYEYADMSPPNPVRGRDRFTIVLHVPPSRFDEFDPKRDFNLVWDEGRYGILFPPRLCDAIVTGRKGARRFCSMKSDAQVEKCQAKVEAVREATKPSWKRRSYSRRGG